MNKFEQILSETLDVDVSKSKAFFRFRKQQLFLATRQSIVKIPESKSTKVQIKTVKPTSKVKQQMAHDREQHRQVVRLNHMVNQMNSDSKKFEVHRKWREEKLIEDILQVATKQLKQERIEIKKQKTSERNLLRQTTAMLEAKKKARYVNFN